MAMAYVGLSRVYSNLNDDSSADAAIAKARELAPGLSEKDRIRIGLQAKHLEAARKNLAATLPKPFIETAIESANGTASFLEKDCGKAAADLKEIRFSSKSGAAGQGFGRQGGDTKKPQAGAAWGRGSVTVERR